jgi:hypothetical protein
MELFHQRQREYVLKTQGAAALPAYDEAWRLGEERDERIAKENARRRKREESGCVVM